MRAERIEAKIVALMALIGLPVVFVFSRLGIGYPIVDYLTQAGKFDDFYNSLALLPSIFDEKASYLISPFSYWVYRGLALMPADRAFFFYNLGFFALLAAMVAKHRGLRTVFVPVMFLYPLWFAVSRANMDMYVFLLVYGFMLSFRKEKLLSAVLLALAVAMKPPLCVFALLYVSEKEYRWTFVAGALSAFLFLGSLLAMPKGFGTELHAFLETYKNYQFGYAVGDGGLLHGNSLFGGLKLASYHLFQRGWLGTDVWTLRQELVSMFGYVKVPIAAFCIYQVLAVPRAAWQKFLILCCMNTLTNYVEADYRLLHYIVPLLFFLERPEAVRRSRGLAALFGALMLPKTFVYRTFHSIPGTGACIGTWLNPVLVVAILVLIVRESAEAPRPVPLPDNALQERDPMEVAA